MLKNVKLGRKLVGGFALVASITLFVGGVGLWGVSRLKSDLLEVGDVRLPSVDSLRSVAKEFESLRVAQRTLLNPRLNEADHKRQFENFTKARERYKAAWAIYEPLPQTPEEAELWKQFVPAVENWKKENDQLMKTASELAATDMRNPLALMDDLQRFTTDHYRLSLAALELIENDEKFEGGTDANNCNFGKWLASFKTTNPELNRLLTEMRPSHEAFHASVHRVQELVTKGDKEAAHKLFHGHMQESVNKTFQSFEAMRAEAGKASVLYDRMYDEAMVTTRAKQDVAVGLLTKIIAINNDVAKESGKQSKANSRLATVAALISMSAGVFLALLLGFLLTRSITGPLQKGVKFAETVASGDLTRRIDLDQKDEVGDLARALNSMAGNLGQVIRTISENASTLAGASTELSATATQLASGAEETTVQSNTVAAAAEEMSTNMSSMAASTEEMSANVKTVSAAVEEMTASIGEVAKNAEQAAGVADNAARLAEVSNQRIGELGTAADEIGKVIEVIQDIAEQTNLLALNATIEAARAGDAGKGFAVVATEVKELAKQTAEATEDIRKRIQGIQSATGDAVKSIGEISQVIKNVNDVSRTIASAVEEQSITTKEIAQSVAQTATASSTVSAAVQQSASASQEITKTIAGVDTAARQTAQGATQTQTAGAELSKLAEQLQSIVKQFKV